MARRQPGGGRTTVCRLVAGGGVQGQFNHPKFGGMGQWSQGGMLVIGDMFNHNLKATVAALCAALAELARHAADAQQRPAQHQAQYQVRGGEDLRIATPQRIGGRRSWVRRRRRELRTICATPSSREQSARSVARWPSHGLRHPRSSHQRSLAATVGRSNRDVQLATWADRPVTAGIERCLVSSRVVQPAAPRMPKRISSKKSSGLPRSMRKGILTDTEVEAKKSELLARL